MSSTSPAAPFRVRVIERGNLRDISIDGIDLLGRSVDGLDHGSWTDFFAEAANRLGTRRPVNRTNRAFPPHTQPVQPLLDEPVSDKILYGYGDPWVLKDESTYYLVVTSNDAPHTFPILCSNDLTTWEMVGSAFPPTESGLRGASTPAESSKPSWAMIEPGKADFWAPEIHKVGDRFVLCFSARQHNDEMAIGLAVASSPKGPFEAEELPLLYGNVIDAHLFKDDDGSLFLFWKTDNNDRWPKLLMNLLERRPDLISRIFPCPQDCRTVQLLLGLWPWARKWKPIERFFVLQVMIEAALQNYSRLISLLRDFGTSHGELEKEVSALVEALYTPVQGQRLNPESMTLEGEPFEVIRNDLEWEGHLIEGMCMVKKEGRYFLFYSGNDFSTPEYGIGYAVAPSPSGPFEKPLTEPIVRSTDEWWGPGHPSVAPGIDEQPILFMHAYQPGNAGYKAFRAMLGARLEFCNDRVLLRAWR